jgi:hypothetical protein
MVSQQGGVDNTPPIFGGTEKLPLLEGYRYLLIRAQSLSWYASQFAIKVQELPCWY